MERVKKAEFKLIGLRLNGKTANNNGQSSIDCGNLWQKFERENFAERIPGKLSDEIYAVYYDYEGDNTKPFSYFIGCNVKTDTHTPAGMDGLVIPAKSFTKVIAKGKMPDCVADSWKNIWNSKIARAYQYDFEIYDERSKDWSNAEVDIFVSDQQEEPIGTSAKSQQ
ncbi:MAG TPA: GyrI-like domain-containing protein [Hanamia sp.]|jgi:predicted transcriptional regulator YdeE|nr:GyrI-like domain-containing protein [Hanamia sp.]